MTIKSYTFLYHSSVDDSESEFPISSRLNAEHCFEDSSTWVPILYQFCKFLEASGYVGVSDKVIISEDGGPGGGVLFQTSFSDMKEDVE
jgi:hypothetical protein